MPTRNVEHDVLRRELGGEAPECVPHVGRRAHRTERVVLVQCRQPEHGREGLGRDELDLPAVTLDRRLHLAAPASCQPQHGLGIKGGARRRREVDSRRETVTVFRPARTGARRPAPARVPPARATGASSAGSWVRMACWRSRSLLPGSIPSSSTSSCAGGAVGLQRLGLAAAAVEREDQLHAQRLMERVLAHEQLELSDELRVAAEREILVDPGLEAREPQLGQPPDLAGREALVGEVRKRRPPPERERLRRLARLGEPDEPGDVELTVADAEAVTGRCRLETAPADHLPELRDVHLQRLERGVGRLLVPERLDEAVRGHDVVGVEQERSQERPLLLPAEVEGPAVLDNLERSQDPELHRRHTANLSFP